MNYNTRFVSPPTEDKSRPPFVYLFIDVYTLYGKLLV